MTITKKIITRYKQLSTIFVCLVIGLFLYLLGYNLLANIIYTIITLWVLLPMAYGMVKDVAKGAFGIDVLAVIAVTASLALQEYLAAIVIVLMIASGRALEDYAQEHAKKELNDLLKQAPKIAHKKQAKEYVDIAVDSIEVEDLLLVKPGEVVPVDATIVKGVTSVDESALTGESMPIDKTVGDTLLSGSINQQSAITIRALRISKDSQYEQIIAMVANAASSKSPFVRLADIYSVPFTIVSLLIAGTAWAISGESIRALEVLVLATPCPLLIATPVALVAGMSNGARQGIIFKHGAALEKLAKSKMIAFDKTGTLTAGKPKVSEILSFDDGYSANEILALAAAAESNSTHTLALAVCDKAKENTKVTMPSVSGVKETIGSGISAFFNKKKVLVGKSSFIENNDIKISKANFIKMHGSTAIFVALDNKCIGAISFYDSLRPESKKTLLALRKIGITNFTMLTGDKHSAAKRIAKDIGITHVKADCLPADKLTELAKLKQSYSPLAFVGDGINDAPSLAAADVGIALGAKGSTAASEAADVVIMLDDFYKVATAANISKRTIKIAKQSIFLGIGLSIFLMLVAGATGLIKPVYGALIQEVVDVAVILLALRARK